MTEAIPHAAFAHIAQQVAAGAIVTRAWPLRGGISARMTGLELLLADGASRRVIVRQPGSWAVAENPDAAAREYQVLQVVRGVGLRAPAPLLLDVSAEIMPAPYLVVEFVEGEVEHSPVDAEAFVRQVAEELARIHRVDAGHPGLVSLPSWRDWMAEVRAERPVEADESLEPRRIRAALAATWPLPHANAAGLLHGDPWPGNIVWRDGLLAAFIDWEEAHVGDPLEDLAIARFDVLSMLGRGAMDELTRVYAAAQPGVDLTDLPYWDLYAALRPVNNISDWAGGWAALGRPDITADALRDRHREFVAQAWEALA